MAQQIKCDNKKCDKCDNSFGNICMKDKKSKIKKHNLRYKFAPLQKGFIGYLLSTS